MRRPAASTDPSPLAPATHAQGPARSWRRAWQLLLGLLLMVIAGLAFHPHPPASIDSGWDKLNHAAAFAVLGAVGWLAQPPGRWRGWRALAGLLAYGAFIEVVQTLIPERSGEWRDLLADGIGLALGIGPFLLAARIEALAGRRQPADRSSPRRSG